MDKKILNVLCANMAKPITKYGSKESNAHTKSSRKVGSMPGGEEEDDDAEIDGVDETKVGDGKSDIAGEMSDPNIRELQDAAEEFLDFDAVERMSLDSANSL